MRTLLQTTGLVGLLLFTACGHGTAQEDASAQASACTVTSALRPMATEIRETSGLARSRAHPDVFWTHNDSGNEPVLYAIAQDGTIKTRIPLRNARLADWEDMEGGPCGDAYCLYLADIGDNAGARKHITIYEVVEPQLTARDAGAARVIEASYPDGPQDAEALFRLPDGAIYIVTKGRQKSIKLYRLNPAGTNGQGSLQMVRELFAQPRAQSDRVTAATASPDGKWVAMRSYATLYVYRTGDLLASGAPAITQSLVPLAERQGESITLDNDGTIWLTSEAERQDDLPTMVGLRCDFARLN